MVVVALFRTRAGFFARQWIAEDRALQIEEPKVARAEFVPLAHSEMVVDKAQIIAMQTNPRALILDVRVAERYEGKIEPIDPRAGHVPGAKNAPLAGNLRGGTDMRLLSPNDLRNRFDRLGASAAEQIAVYCGSGINASQAVFALYLAGFEQAKLYEGSWSDWSRDASLPAATGPNPK